MISVKRIVWAKGAAAILLFMISSLSSAQTIKELAVENCIAAEGQPGIFFGASYILASNMEPGAEFICPIDAARVSPDQLEAALVYVYDGDNANSTISAEICFTDMAESSFPSETCGVPAITMVGGSSVLKVSGPKMKTTNKTMAAFIRVWVPAPYQGYSFLRGYEVWGGE